MGVGMLGFENFGRGFEYDMRESSTQALYNIIKNDFRVMALTSDGRNNVYEKIRINFPKQYMDYGISECNMVSSAAGLSSCGMIPFIFGTTNFIAMRAFEFIRNDVAIPNMNVKFIGIFSGLARGGWGPTHQGTEELSLLRCLPNFLVITPATPLEAREATVYAYHHVGPVYLRIEASNEQEYFDESYQFQLGKGNVIQSGNDVTIITIGSIVSLAIKIALKLKKHNINIRVINMPVVQPIDEKIIIAAAKETRGIISLEEHSIYGGLGSAIAEVLAENQIGIRFCRLGLHGCAVGCGNRDEIRELNGINEERIIDKVMEFIG